LPNWPEWWTATTEFFARLNKHQVKKNWMPKGKQHELNQPWTKLVDSLTKNKLAPLLADYWKDRRNVPTVLAKEVK